MCLFVRSKCGGTVAPRDAFVADVLGERVAALVKLADALASTSTSATTTPRTQSSTDIDKMSLAAAFAARITLFSCDHVVPSSRVLVSVLDKGTFLSFVGRLEENNHRLM